MQPETPISLSPELFSEANPFHFAFDAELRIDAVGTSLAQHAPNLQLGATLEQCFHLRHPNQPITQENIADRVRQLVVMECRNSPLVLRGQILPHSAERFVFVGSPWFSSAEDMAAAGLKFDDFAIHDPVIDLLQLIQSQFMAYQDVKAAIERLKGQKQKLTEANANLEQQYQTLQETEQRLRQKESEAQKLALVAEGTDNAVIITDAQGRIEWVNGGFTKQTEYTLDEVVGKKPGAFLQGEGTNPETVRYMSEQLAKGEAFQVEILNYTKSKTPHWIEVEVQPVRDQGGAISNFIAIETDITERKHTEDSLLQAKRAAEEASQLKSEFLATVSHEIRTPMNGILGMSELLLESRLDSKQLGLLQTIRSSADSLLAVINDVLDLSKIESGKLEAHDEQFSLRELVDNVLGSACERCAQNRVELNAIVEADISDGFLGDRSKLQQILINLVGNAAKFTTRGEVRLEVRQLAATAGKVDLEFKVIDTGIGFDESETQKLFESFRQSDSSLARKHGGTGLGLSISQRLVEFLGGTIAAKGKPNEGAEFTCKIPLRVDLHATRQALENDGPPLVIRIDSLPPSTKKALTNHLSFLRIPYFEASSTHQAPISGRTVTIKNETSKATPDSDFTVTLVSIGSAYEAAPSESILIKPLRHLGLRKLLENIAAGTQSVASSPSPTERHRCVPRYENVLVAEDNPVNRQLIREVLGKLNLPARFVSNGNEVLRAIEETPYDCILMDCQMPELDGIETTRRVRQREAQQKSGKPATIIAMTANALVGDRERCLTAGMDDYLAKPFRLADIRERLLVTDKSPKTRHKQANATPANKPMISESIQNIVNDLGVEAAEMLINDVLEDGPQRLDKLDQLLARQERDNLRIEVHAFKSVCLTYGMEETGRIAQSIEDIADSGTLERITELAGQLRPAYELEEGTLKKVLNHLEETHDQ